MSLNFYELCCRMEEDSMNEEWSWRKAALGAALPIAAAASGLGIVNQLSKSEPQKTPSALVRPDERKPDVARQPKIKSIEPKRSEPERTPERTETSGKVTPNFSWSEFGSKDGSPTPNKYKANILKLAKNLEVLREAAGGRPMALTSGYRSPEHNSNVGGEDNSQHLFGKAADIRIKGVSPTDVHALIEKLIAKGKMAQGGLGLYVDKGFVHYDIRGNKVRWVD
jgi:hypothetical protein